MLFNFAAIPVKQTFNDRLIAFAQKSFGVTARDYLLGENAKPHMTLSFFRADNEEDAIKIAADIPHFPATNMSVTTNMIYYRIHSNGTETLFAAGLLVNKTQELEQYQAVVHNYINKEGSLALTPKNDLYWPHFTCAFTSTANAFQLADVASWAFEKIPVRLSLGLSDEAGQFVKEISLV